MGGKHKMANRTKNNVRPSSSGRSAEFLGSTMVPFVGFSTMKDSTFGFSLSTTEELDSSIDPNIQVIFKKLSKKDSTTKIKGLQELADLIKNSDQDTVKAVLPLWPRFYNVFVTDIDNRVREATHSVHHQIILKAKRNIAPFLKQLMAPWFTSQYDPYPPAASVASQALKDAFPPNKIQEAIAYCQEEILHYLSDNLFIQTPQTLCNMKHVSAEEADAKYERVLISCLQGYQFYLEKVSVEQIQNVVELNNNIVGNSKFWKFGKNKVAYIRATWFKLISIICQKAPFLLDGKGAQVTGSVFGNLEESDPTVLPSVWEAALLTMSTIENWWTFINVDKVFYPKLWKILKQGGQGNAAVIYPSLLPVLSHLLPIVNDSSSEFYDKFFENLRLGMRQKTTIASKSESIAVATAYVECFQFIILRKQDKEHFCKTMIKTHLLTVIEWCLTEDHLSCKTIFSKVGALVQFLSRNSETPALTSYLDFLFESVRDLFRETLFNLKENPDYQPEYVSSKQLEFLRFLKSSGKPKKQFKVKFISDDVDSKEDKLGHLPSIIESDKKYLDKLNVLVYKVCQDYVEYIQEKQSTILFEQLWSLIIDFDSNIFFVNLNEKMRHKNPDSRLVDIYYDLLHNWMISETQCCKRVMSLTFLLLLYVENDEKLRILETLSEVPNEQCLSWAISEALAHPHNKDPIIHNWLKTERVSDFLVSIVDLEINDKCPPELGILLKLALTENDEGELFVESTAIAKIIDKLVQVLKNHPDHPITADSCASLAAYVSAIVYTETLLLSYNDTLLLALFHLSCNSQIDNDIISEETMYEVNSAWQDALSLLAKALPREDSLKLTSKLAEVVKREFSAIDLEENKLNHLVVVDVNALRAIYRSLPLALSDFIRVFLDNSFLKSCGEYIIDICMVAEYVRGELCSPYEDIKVNAVHKKADGDKNEAKYFAWTYLTLAVLSSKLEEGAEYDEEEEEDGIEGDIEERAVILNVIDYNEGYLGQVLHDLGVGQSYLATYKNTKCYDQILNYYVLIEAKLKTTLELMDDTFKAQLKATIRDKSTKLGWFWAKSAYILYTDISPEPLTDIYAEFVQQRTGTCTLGALHLTQVFSKHLDYDLVRYSFDAIGDVIVLNSLIRCEDIDVQIAEVFTKIERIRNENVPRFSYAVSNISWEKTQEIIEIVRLCSSLMKYKFNSLSQRHWDFAVLSLVGWASNCLKTRAAHDKYQFQALLVAVMKLYVNVDNQIKEIQNQSVKSNFIEEWKDVLVESIHCDLAQFWLYLAEQLEQKTDSITYLPLVQEFGSFLNNTYYEYIFKTNDTSLPKWTKFLKRCCSLLVNRQPNLQLWGYKMLMNLVPGLVKIDMEAVNTNTPHKKGLIFEQFKEKLVQTHEIVDSMLMEFRLGEDICRVEPSTDSFTYCFAYLLLWDILLSLCDQSSTELRFQYVDWLRNEDLLKNFLNNLFRLMPTSVSRKVIKDSFLRKPEIDITDTCDSEKIESLVCWLYSSSLTQLPALVRQWWTSLDSKLSQMVEKVTQTFVSGNLVTQELNELVSNQSKFKNMTLRVIPGSREVVATYTVDESQVELLIKLPANYPLGMLEVHCNKQIAGAAHKQWILQFKKSVVHQNGRIWDGLSLWNNNLDKKFDGVEECYICFAVLHPGTYQMPKLSCQTCKKKFHSACLYKWFRTSYKSSCPICRNLF
ncbi:unnamed protein product [Phaedon cochleariae]|uniref:E3 ubiquitin-protein ligase listerin n=1 Tax=Phaedon cochleariae TaxID=80249 RepID=A0A9N9SGR4_PHACE|nr:unnamed protein product [Phaedon cochleariae]